MDDNAPDFILLDVNHVEKGTGRKIYNFQCSYCHGTFTNHKNAKEHIKKCKIAMTQSGPKTVTLDDFFKIDNKNEDESQIDSKEEKNEFDSFESSLMNLFAECNIPFSQIDHPAWQDFVHSINPDIELPCSQTFKSAFIEYSHSVLEESLNDMKDMVCGLAVDGTTFRKVHYYATILIGAGKIRLLKIEPVESEDGQTLSKFLSETYKECKKYHIVISGVCSDNGPGIKAALTKDHPLYFKALVGDAVFWLSCSAHTSQLAMGDFLNFNKELKDGIKTFLTLIAWLRKREDILKEYVSCKLPSYVVTRWNTLVDTLQYFIDNHDEVQRFITEQASREISDYQDKIAHSRTPTRVPKPEPPPIDAIPEWWLELFDATKIIREFTDAVEGDLTFQQDLWKAYIATEEKFNEIEATNKYADSLHEFFVYRFIDTCNIDVAHLAYTLTAEGLQNFREEFEFDSDEYYAELGTLKSVLLTIAGRVYTKEEIGKLCISGLFDYYITDVEFDQGDNLFSFWNQIGRTLAKKEGLNNGVPISIKPFADIALIIVMMPCTEAVCERAFSQMKNLLTDHNGKLSTEMFVAEATVRLAQKYKRSYN